MKRIFLVLAFVGLIASCDDSGSQGLPIENGKMLRETKGVITDDNLRALKEHALEEFDRSKLYVIFEEPGFDLQKAYAKVEGYKGKDTDNVDFKDVLGADYNQDYFDNLYRFLAFTTSLYNSPLFDKDSSLESRELIVGDILEFVFDNSQGPQNQTYACGPGYGPCMRKAEKDHKLRMASYTATAALGMALAGWTGVGAAGSAGGWVIAMISSGAQYQIDIEYCEEANCT